MTHAENTCSDLCGQLMIFEVVPGNHPDPGRDWGLRTYMLNQKL